MKKGFIAIIDSGIGGLSVLKSLVEELPNEKYVYFGDNDNVPYGDKSKNDLIMLAMNSLLNLYVKYELKAIVIGCNTISMTVLDKIRGYFDIPVFGVFPPVVLDNTRKTVLLSTERTAEEYLKYGLSVNVLPQSKLAYEIENNAPYFNKISLRGYDFVNQSGFDTVILGCTHYFFIKNQIFDHLKPRRILSGESFTAKFVKNYLQKNKSLEKTYGNSVLFFGKSASKNKLLWDKVVKTVKLYDKKV